MLNNIILLYFSSALASCMAEDISDFYYFCELYGIDNLKDMENYNDYPRFD